MEGLNDIFDFYGPFFFDEADSCLVKSEGQGENVVVRFDCRKGVLKNRIRRGRGPGEYLDLRVVGVNPATGDFQAVSSVGRSVVSLSLIHIFQVADLLRVLVRVPLLRPLGRELRVVHTRIVDRDVYKRQGSSR